MVQFAFSCDASSAHKLHLKFYCFTACFTARNIEFRKLAGIKWVNNQINYRNELQFSFWEIYVHVLINFQIQFAIRILCDLLHIFGKTILMC